MNLSANNKKTLVDPVCGMAVDPVSTGIITTINGDTYYFCMIGDYKSAGNIQIRNYRARAANRQKYPTGDGHIARSCSHRRRCRHTDSGC